MSIFIIDCGIGNVGSIRSMYRRLGFFAELIRAPLALAPGDKLILPGVGAFDAGVEAIERHGFEGFIRAAVADGHSLLGICLGMQLLGCDSEEGQLQGLGLIPAHVRRIRPGSARLRVPHMGWNIARPVRDNPLLPIGQEEQRFYFVHGYHMVCDEPSDAVAVTTYGEDVVSAVGRDKVWGVQFHPEKSHRFGRALLERFARIETAHA